MGCVRSKEDKGPALKYRPENPNATPVNAHLGHYGPDPTLMGHSPVAKTHNNSYNSHTASLTPFGGASSVMAPFGGASTSYTSVAVSSPFPGVITGQFELAGEEWGGGFIRFQADRGKRSMYIHTCMRPCAIHQVCLVISQRLILAKEFFLSMKSS